VGHNNETPNTLARLVRIRTSIRYVIDRMLTVGMESLIVSLSFNKITGLSHGIIVPNTSNS